MTFSIRNLSVLAYANGFTLWHYKVGGSPVSAIRADNFFREAADMFQTGDMIMVTASDGCTILCVASNKSERVVLASLALP